MNVTQNKVHIKSTKSKTNIYITISVTVFIFYLNNIP